VSGSKASSNGSGPGKRRSRQQQASARRSGSKTGFSASAAATARQTSDTAAKAETVPQPKGWRRFTPTPRSMGWLPFITFVLSVIGLADAGYQVYTHFTGTGLLGCSAKADACVLVQNSQYAWIFHIPVAVYGVVFFAFMIAICSPWGWRLQQPLVRHARLAAVIVGMIFVLYLMYRELISLDQICPYCTSVHIITFGIFALVVYEASAPKTAIPARARR
jgi:uncharacterized membrane protein